LVICQKLLQCAEAQLKNSNAIKEKRFATNDFNRNDNQTPYIPASARLKQRLSARNRVKRNPEFIAQATANQHTTQ